VPLLKLIRKSEDESIKVVVAAMAKALEIRLKLLFHNWLLEFNSRHCRM